MAPELPEILAKLSEMQTGLEDHERRIIELESLVAGLVIPRLRSPSLRSEYVVEVEPAYGTPETLKIKARSQKEALEKAKARFPIPVTAKIVATPKQELKLPSGSRWVLELYPDEISVWRDYVRVLEPYPLTERERSFLRSLDYYIQTERKITVPMLSWLYIIARRTRAPTLPEVPYPRR